MILAAVKTLDEILDFASYLLAKPARRAHGQEIRVLSTKVVADMVEPIEAPATNSIDHAQAGYAYQLNQTGRRP